MASGPTMASTQEVPAAGSSREFASPIRKARLIIIRASSWKRTQEVARPTAFRAGCSLDVGPGGGTHLIL